MEIQKEEKKGEVYIFSGAVLWALFPVFIALSYAGVSGLTSFAWSSLLATIFFGGVVIYKNSWQEIKNKILLKYILLITLFNAFLYYIFYYLSLEHTSPGNVALLAQTEILTSFLFFHVYKKDNITKEHILGILFMLIGSVIVLSRNFTQFNIGDILILLAVLAAPIGNHFQQKARKIASTESILFWRTLFATPFIFLLAALFDKEILFTVDVKIIILLAFNGVLILGVSKIFWIEGIHRIPVTKALALSALAPLLTLLVSWIALHQPPTLWQLISFAPLFLGVLLLTDNIKFKNPT